LRSHQKGGAPRRKKMSKNRKHIKKQNGNTKDIEKIIQESKEKINKEIILALEKSKLAEKELINKNIDKAKLLSHKAMEMIMDIKTDSHILHREDEEMINKVNNSYKTIGNILKKAYGDERPYFSGDSIAE
jgi:CHASE3 domain sensor protein